MTFLVRYGLNIVFVVDSDNVITASQVTEPALKHEDEVFRIAYLLEFISQSVGNQ